MKKMKNNNLLLKGEKVTVFGEFILKHFVPVTLAVILAISAIFGFCFCRLKANCRYRVSVAVEKAEIKYINKYGKKD